MKRLIKAATVGAALAPFVIGANALAGEVRVGSVAGVTGPIAELVAPIVGGRNLAAGDINAQGGLLGGDKLVMVLADSQCDPKAGVDAGNKVVNVEQVVAIVGASCSGATNGMVQSVTIPAGIPSVSDSATAPSITDLNDSGLVYRTAPSDAYQGAALAKLAWDAGYRNLAVTYANDDYNAGIAGVFASSFEGLGGKVTANQLHEPNKASYRAEITTLSGGGAEGLALFAYYGGSGITIIRNALETGAFGKFMAADGMFDASVIEQIGAGNLRGNLMITQSASDPENASYQIFAEAFAKTGMDPAAPYAAHGYDATFLVALAIEKAGAADPAKIAAALSEVANAPGEVVRPGEWEKAKALIAAGKDVNYEGASGSVDFDSAGDVPGFYSVNTIGDDGKYKMEFLR
jgi:branched-chain amino acid transport system substrate-binding protein